VDAELSNRVGEAYERFVPAAGQGQLIELEHLVRYGWASGLAAGRRILDAGCGVGYGTAMLAGAGATEAVGVDVAPEAIEAAARTAPANATFLTAEVHALPFDDGSFDLVVCFEVLEHLERQQEAIAELARVLAHGGVLAVSSPNRGVYPAGNPHHVHEYTPRELRIALAEHFAHVDLRRQHDWVASAVLDDDQVADASVRERSDVAMAKAHAMAPGSESYTLALASRVPLPPAPGRVVLGGVEEIREWLRLEQLDRELAQARADVATLQGVEARLRGDNAVLLEQLEQLRTTLRGVHGSLSWRVTRPLRALNRLRRQMRVRAQRSKRS
jgi:2-polyprenyl-3-methyl-5-hydroxy-6-metoxy-1,4-benzoquinol methylase